MLDTIAINIQRKDFTIHKPERFNPHAGAFSNPLFGDGGIVKCFYNPTKKDKVAGYLPRLTLFKKPFGNWADSTWLKIEFSAPKLIYGNNFEELYGSEDLDRIIKALLKALEHMGIETTYEVLLSAKINAIHYAKNILLEKETPCHLLIQTLEKMDISAQLDLNQTDFRNGGQMAKYHASTFEIAIYDKVKDLEQAKKYGAGRGAETDYDCQRDFLKDYQKPEVLRIEIRLKARKAKNLLGTLGIKRGNTLQELFCPNVSRAVLLHYWKVITNGLYIMNIDAESTEKLIGNIKQHFPKKSPNTILSLTAFILTCQQIGIRGARLLLGLNNSQYYRLKADAKKLEQNHRCPRFQILTSIYTQLKEFIPLVKEDIVDIGLLK